MRVAPTRVVGRVESWALPSPVPSQAQGITNIKIPATNMRPLGTLVLKIGSHLQEDALMPQGYFFLVSELAVLLSCSQMVLKILAVLSLIWHLSLSTKQANLLIQYIDIFKNNFLKYAVAFFHRFETPLHGKLLTLREPKYHHSEWESSFFFLSAVNLKE